MAWLRRFAACEGKQAKLVPIGLHLVENGRKIAKPCKDLRGHFALVGWRKQGAETKGFVELKMSVAELIINHNGLM